MIRFILASLALVGTIWLVLALGVHYQLMPEMPSFAFFILPFLLITTTVIFVKLYRSKGKEFVQLFIGTIVLKFIAYGVILTYIILQDRPGAAANTVLFLATYLLLTIAEIGLLYTRLQEK